MAALSTGNYLSDLEFFEVLICFFRTANLLEKTAWRIET
jgi:hypothetical protein